MLRQRFRNSKKTQHNFIKSIFLQKTIIYMDSTKENSGRNNQRPASIPYEVTAEGSLGLLALGAVGIRAWRKKREEEKLKTNQDKNNE